MAVETQETLKASLGLEDDVPVNLSDALADLHDVREEVDEDGFTPPSDLAIENAERMLRVLYDILPWQYEVYPMAYGMVAIHAANGKGSSVMALCESDGGAMWLANLKSGHRGDRYKSAADLPNAPLRDALLELMRDTN